MRTAAWRRRPRGKQAKAARWLRGMTPDHIAQLQARAAKLFAEDLEDEGRGSFLDIPVFLAPPGCARRSNLRERRGTEPQYA